MDPDPDPGDDGWETLGVPVDEVAGWEALGFGPFQAALAHGDGFTPVSAAHYRRQLRKTADAWWRAGLGSPSGLAWHRAGFAVSEAIRWRSAGVPVEVATGLRDGYRHDSTHMEERPRFRRSPRRDRHARDETA